MILVKMVSAMFVVGLGVVCCRWFGATPPVG
jgi:hypothetical protein